MKRHEHPPIIPECRFTCSLLAGSQFSLDQPFPFMLAFRWTRRELDRSGFPVLASEAVMSMDPWSPAASLAAIRSAVRKIVNIHNLMPKMDILDGGSLGPASPDNESAGDAVSTATKALMKGAAELYEEYSEGVPEQDCRPAGGASMAKANLYVIAAGPVICKYATSDDDEKHQWLRLP